MTHANSEQSAAGSRFDLAIIGAGPAGYVAAIRAAQLGMHTLCIDDFRDQSGRPVLGGSCLNVGCIPSKALLDSSLHYFQAHQASAAHGIEFDALRFDLATMQGRKQQVVDTLTRGIAGLFQRHQIEWLAGRARLLGEGAIEVSLGEQRQRVEAERIVIATGATPAIPLFVTLDGERVVDSTAALAFDQVPNRLGIIGAGAIALELGSVWGRLGAEVHCLELSERLLPLLDREAARVAERALAAQGVGISLAAELQEVHREEERVEVLYRQHGELKQLECDRLLVATGRRPNLEGLGVDELAVQRDSHGFIQVDSDYRTNLPNLYAIGDVIGGPMLAHKASEEGIALVERLAGQRPSVNYRAIPWVIYSAPEIAWVGANSEQLERAGVPYRVGRFPLQASGRARALGESSGLIILFAHAESDQLLGAQLVAPHASELIGELVLGLEFSASAEDIARTIHAHPSLSETLREAALAVDKRALHR